MLGRRNLDRADRDEMIRRLAARGVKQKDIAEKTGLSKQAVSKIVSPESTKWTEKQINAVSPAAEVEAKQAELDSLRKRLKDEQDERDTPGPITKNNVPEEFSAPLKGLPSRGRGESPFLWKRRCLALLCGHYRGPSSRARAEDVFLTSDHIVDFNEMVLHA